MIYDYTTLNVKEIEKKLKTNFNLGLTTQQVTELQKQYGLNKIQETKSKWLKLLASQFTSPFIYLLLIAALLSITLETNKSNAVIITLIIIINSLLSFIQEYRAAQAVELLSKHLAINAKVKRNNTPLIIDSTNLVPGDIVFLQPGDYVPADIRLIESENLTVDESMLTGESKLAKKDSNQLTHQAKDIYSATNIVFLGTIISTGSAIGIVIATGAQSLFGSITQLTSNISRLSTLQTQIKKLSALIMRLIFLTITAIFLFNILLKPGHTNIIELLLFSITLAISITPEALPVVITFSLSRGAMLLAKNNVIVKRLSAIEDLGSISILCTDKTGTLTENKLSVADIYDYKNGDPLLYSLIAADPKNTKHLGAIDASLWQKAPENYISQISEYEIIKQIPFDSFLRRNIVLAKHDKQYIIISRGAYEEIIKRSSNINEKEKESIEQWITQQGSQARRILAVSYKILKKSVNNLTDQEHDMKFSGLIALEDPIKPTAQQAVEKANRLGVSLKMLTGDSKEVAQAVAYKINLIENPNKVITGSEFDKLSALQKQKAVTEYSIFARMLPQQKYEVVQLLKSQATVGFLGDGINDSPALKMADVGISVKNAADIAKESADIVLLKNSLDVIINGIAQGRIVFNNVLKYIRATLSSNFGNFYSIAIASLIIDFLPLLPLQILLVNLLSDLPMISISTDNVDPKEIEKPSTYNTKDIALLATILGITSSVFDFMFFALFYHSIPAKLQTLWFIENVLTELVFVFSIRTKQPFYKSVRPSGLLIILTFICAIITIALPYTVFGQKYFKFITPAIPDIAIIFILIFFYFITTEIVKLFYYKWLNNNNKK